MSLPRLPEPDEGESRLLRDILGTAAHDIGGLSSALALRAETLGGDEARAVGAIAAELRIIGRQLRHLRGGNGDERLMPTTSGALLQWWALMERFGRPALGRGFTLTGRVPEYAIAPAQAEALGYGVLALQHAIGSDEPLRPASVHVEAIEENAHVRVQIRVHGADGVTREFPSRQAQWYQVAERAFRRGGLDVHAHASGVEIHIPPRAT